MLSRSRRRSLAHTFAVPAALALLMAAGLASGVLGDGVWDVISWITLGAPIVVVVFYFLV